MIDINAKKENCLARDKEFLSIYNDAFNFMIENRVPDPHNRALHWTIENGQPHYNLSYSRAYRVVCQMLTGDRIAFNSHLRQMMWSEICKKVKSLTTLHPDMSIAKALDFVLFARQPLLRHAPTGAAWHSPKPKNAPTSSAIHRRQTPILTHQIFSHHDKHNQPKTLAHHQY